MGNSSCRVKPNEHAKRRLWSESGGYCLKPTCSRYLFTDEKVDFAEMAHVIAALPGGPRDVPVTSKSLSARADPENLILLCANCHKVVDKASSSYPAEMLLGWKARHHELLLGTFGTPKYQTRSEARNYVESLLAANQAVHSMYGPVGEPYADGKPALWQRHARTTVIPNNRTVLRLVEANRHLLTEEEKQTVVLFSLHVDQFEARHILEDWSAGTAQFPEQMKHIFQDGPYRRS